MNKIYINITVLIAVLLIASCASPDNGSQNEAGDDLAVQGESAPSENDPNEIICRNEMITGSNFRRRVCLTRAQRESMRQGSTEEMIRNRSRTLGTGASQGPAQ